jgi:hypothetical protein
LAEITTAEVKELLKKMQGKEVTLAGIRKELQIQAGTKSFDAVRNILFQLSEQRDGDRIIRPSGKKDGVYKVIEQVDPVSVFGVERERRPIFELIFPRDFDTMEEMSLAKDVVIREGDLITLGGVKSKGKTTLCLNFCGENIEKHPVLMGNEYTVQITDEKNNGKPRYEPAPRFLNRLDTMDANKDGWINWIDVDGKDKFLLLPVRDDYAEHIVKNRINIIDWINLGGERLFDIGKVLEEIKSNLGRGIALIALQKSESADNPRGGQFVRDFSDLELLLDGYRSDEDDILLTIKGCKEKHSPIVGRTYAYTIGGGGTKILNFREVKKCPACRSSGYVKGDKCGTCNGNKFMDVHQDESLF